MRSYQSCFVYDVEYLEYILRIGFLTTHHHHHRRRRRRRRRFDISFVKKQNH